MPLLQMHHQRMDGTTEMIAQREIDSPKEHMAWMKELWESHPPPDGCVWLACNERSRHFVMTTQ